MNRTYNFQGHRNINKYESRENEQIKKKINIFGMLKHGISNHNPLRAYTIVSSLMRQPMIGFKDRITTHYIAYCNS